MPSCDMVEKLSERIQHTIDRLKQVLALCDGEHKPFEVWSAYLGRYPGIDECKLCGQYKDCVGCPIYDIEGTTCQSPMSMVSRAKGATISPNAITLFKQFLTAAIERLEACTSSPTETSTG